MIWLKHYLKVAFRHLIRDKWYSVANVLGLSLGLSSFLLIYLFVWDELNVDSFNTQRSDIYRLVKNNENALFGPGAGRALKDEDNPMIEDIIRWTRANGTELKHEDKQFTTTSLYFVDSELTQHFTFEVLSGSAEDFHHPNAVIITDKAAKKYFGEDNPIGRLMVYQKEFPVKVAMVVKDESHRSHIGFDVLINHQLQDNQWRGESILTDKNAWFWSTTACYLVKKKNVDEGLLESDIKKFYSRHIDSDRGRLTEIGLQPFSEVYLNSENISGFQRHGNMSYVYALSLLAILILVVGSFNFINLMTTKSIGRARETGIRKSLGAFRKQLSVQYMTEVYLTVSISLLLAVVLTQTFIPYYTDFIGRDVSFEPMDHTGILLILFLSVGLLSGIYPALVMSSFSPITALKGEIKNHRSGFTLRNFLLTGQFLIGLVVVSVALIIYLQVEFIQHKELGFRKDKIVVIDFPEIPVSKFNLLKQELTSHTNIQTVGGSWIPAFQEPGEMGPVKTELDGEMTEVAPGPHFLWIDKAFFDAYEIQFVAGSNFTKEFSATNREFIINETASRLLGYQSFDEAVGKRFESDQGTGVIAGVAKDFHFESLHHTIKPLVLFREPARINVMSLKLGSGDTPSTTGFIEETLAGSFPDEVFPLNFLEATYDSVYAPARRMRNMFVFFSLLGLFMECLGLFALVSHAILLRRKELGIRKILGASTANLILQLNRRFIIRIVVAFLFATPIAYLFVSSWLNEFAYHIRLTPWPFLAAGGLTIAFAFLITSLKSFKAANSNLSEVIRNE